MIKITTINVNAYSFLHCKKYNTPNENPHTPCGGAGDFINDDTLHRWILQEEISTLWIVYYEQTLSNKLNSLKVLILRPILEFKKRKLIFIQNRLTNHNNSYMITIDDHEQAKVWFGHKLAISWVTRGGTPLGLTVLTTVQSLNGAEIQKEPSAPDPTSG